jgi:hypothetical protein
MIRYSCGKQHSRRQVVSKEFLPNCTLSIKTVIDLCHGNGSVQGYNNNEVIHKDNELVEEVSNRAYGE